MHPMVRRLLASALLLLGAWGSPQAQTPPPRYVIKVSYIVPSDRRPTPDYRAKITRVMHLIQQFYADQMEANGFGRMTFELDEDEGKAVNVSLVRADVTTKQLVGSGPVPYSGSPYSENAIQVLRAAGIHPKTPGVVRMVFMETQEFSGDMRLLNDMSVGSASYLSGVAFMTGTVLELSDPQTLHDARPYGGLTIPSLNPKPLVSGKSFPDYDGPAVNSLSATYLGAVAHELAHAFGASHCGLPDTEPNGYLMAAGFRGFRGYLMPNAFPNEDCRLDRACAVLLSLSPFLQRPEQHVLPTNRPEVEILTRKGPMHLENAKFSLSFSASEEHGPGIALVTLENGTAKDGVGVVAFREYPNHPKHIADTLETAFVHRKREDRWRLVVWDAAGIGQDAFVTLQAPDEPLGPKPGIRVAHSRVVVGAPVTFTAFLDGQKFIPECRWNFGDGGSATGVSATHSFARAGVYEVKLQATGHGGESSTSIFISVQIAPPKPPRIDP